MTAKWPAHWLWIWLTVIGLSCVGPSAAEPRWVTASQIGPTYVKADFRLDDRVLNALSHLDSTKSDLQTRLGLSIPSTPIELTLFRARRGMDAYIRSRVPEGVGRAALFVKSGNSSRVYAYYNSKLDVDLRHESTHAFLHAGLPYVPLWLDEGLAEYFEVEPRQRISGHPHLKSLKRAMWFRWKPNLERLESLSSLADMKEDEYRESWAWAHFMLHGPEPARTVLRTYLADIARGEFAGKLEPKLAAAVGDPGAALKAHLKAVR